MHVQVCVALLRMNARRQGIQGVRKLLNPAHRGAAVDAFSAPERLAAADKRLIPAPVYLAAKPCVNIPALNKPAVNIIVFSVVFKRGLERGLFPNPFAAGNAVQQRDDFYIRFFHLIAGVIHEIIEELCRVAGRVDVTDAGNAADKVIIRARGSINSFHHRRLQFGGYRRGSPAHFV